VTGTTNTVNAATGQTYTIGNAYSLVEALPARHQPRASFMANLTIINRSVRFAGPGSTKSRPS
jgi:predicted phage gp36 major capsid-like protein